MGDHPDALEADLHRYHGLHLWADLGTDRLPWCRFRAFLGHLPWDSAYAREIAGGKGGVTLDQQLLGLLVDRLTLQLWAQQSSKDRGPQPKPVLAELMGVEVRGSSRRSAASPEELLARLRAQALDQQNEG